PFLHHGSSLRRLHRGSPSWLHPSVPPWLLPPSSPPWTLLVIFLTVIRPPPKLPSVINKPSPRRATEPRIDPSELVREPATEHASVEEARERKGLKERPVHCTSAESEIPLDSKDLKDSYLDLYADMAALLSYRHSHITLHPGQYLDGRPPGKT
ncbi:hypothetical protein M9458_021673, partial [Cirrhinus mrigala]